MKFELDYEGTHYTLWKFQADHDTRRFAYVYAVETGWGEGYGQWVRLYDDEIAWSYLMEKMPAIREGDKPGLRLLFEKAGLEVFDA